MTPREHTLRIARAAAERRGIAWSAVIGMRVISRHETDIRNAVIRDVAEEKPYLSARILGEVFNIDPVVVEAALKTSEAA